MRIVAIAALHRSFENFVMKRFVEIGLHLCMTTHAELWLTEFQQMNGRKVGFFRIRCAYKGDGLRDISINCRRVRRVTIRTANVVPPVFSTPEIVPFLFARVAKEAGLRDLFGALVLEGNNLARIAFCDVGLAWTMAGLATSYSSIPVFD